MNVLYARDNIKTIDKMIKANMRIAESVGPSYFNYLNNIFQKIIQVYTFYSGQINFAVNSGAQDQNIVKPMKAVRRDILRLI